MEVLSPYHLYLDYKGYLIEPRSYRVMPAPLMGTRFATGRQAYSNLDFWQVGAMTDFTHGINQKFLVDPSASFVSLGIDCSKPGEFKLERDLTTQALPSSPGMVTSRYRSATALYLGTASGKILKSINGTDFTLDGETGTGKIYCFYELNNKLFACKGPYKSWVLDGTWKEVEAEITGTLVFTNGSDAVTGTDTKFTTQLWPGCHIQLEADGVWVEVKSVTDDTHLVLTANYSGTGGTGASKLALEDIYFVMVESDYGFGLFDDGIRRSTDGYSWIPIPPDPLWTLPSSEGIGINAIAIPRGFIIGSKRGLWVFVGGSSGINLWLFPDYVSDSNFAGLDKWGHYGIFSVENQGIFYTDGVQTYPTNLNYLNEGFVFKSCKSIVASGWDILALVSDGTDWYLARCNLNYTRIPKYWWLVKKLSKTPCNLASYSDTKAFIFFEDGSAEVYNKISGDFQSTGYLTTSLIDENLVRLQKQYKAISAIFESFPTSTSAKLAYRHDISETYTEKSFTGANQRESVFSLRNPVIENRIQIKVTLGSTDVAKSPVVADLCWTYILDSPSEEGAIKKTFYFTIIGEDKIEQLTGEVEELGRQEPRTRQEIITDLWTTRAKKQLLNFIGADNKREYGLEIAYVGAGASCLLAIDRTNYEITTKVDGVVNQTISYKDKTIKQISDTIDALAGYTCNVHQDQEDSRSAHDLEPVKDLEIKGEKILYLGSDIYSVIFNPQSPGQVKLAFEGAGSDRINMGLREA